jgi:hypothetical protein
MFAYLYLDTGEEKNVPIPQTLSQEARSTRAGTALSLKNAGR